MEESYGQRGNRVEEQAEEKESGYLFNAVLDYCVHICLLYQVRHLCFCSLYRLMDFASRFGFV